MRWVVGLDDGRTVRAVLAAAGADANAVREGRVFVGLQRVKRDDERVRIGDVVDVSPRRSPRHQSVDILAETDDLVAVDKPAGIPTVADHAGACHALVALTAQKIGVGESELHPTSRLDRDVSGVVVFARTPAATRRLERARAQGAYQRRYVAIAGAAPAVARGTWDAPIGRGRDPRHRAVGGRDAVAATTRYAVCALAPGQAALLAVAPLTGRTHQIRVHAAYAGAALIGDRTYGGPPRIALPSGRVLEPRRIALHAARVVVPNEHGSPLTVIAPVPADLANLWSLLGGDPGAWELALACAVG